MKFLMKRWVFTFMILASAMVTRGQQPEFELKVTLKPYTNQYIYLGYYYGKQKPIFDSAKLDEHGHAVFRSAKKLEKGIYLVGYPDKSGYFEILIDKDQKFSVYADANDIPGSVTFQGSPDNTTFIEYQKYTSGKGREIEAAKKSLETARTKADSAKINEQIRTLGYEIQNYRNNLISSKPDATISSLLNAMKDPVIPPASQHPGGVYDSMFAYRYYKDHFWDGTNFYDEKLVRTTFFEQKLDQYFEQLVLPDPDSVIYEIDWMLGYASISPEMQRYLLVKFVNRYINPKYMWDDRVFVYLFEKHFSNKEYPWLTEQSKKTIFDRAYSMMANLFGTQASDINLPDSTGKRISLFAQKDSFTVVLFWDPTCGHCKETLPQIDSIYRAKWKAAGVQLFAISKETEGTQKDWKNFIRDNGLKGWTHVYYSKADDQDRTSNNIPSYFQLYDVQTVPTLYLLDRDKRILAKKIPFEQIDEVLTHKLNRQ